MTSFHFTKYLNGEFIESVMNEFGFTEGPIVEKFIMDYEMLHAISQDLPCVTRGGTAVPFYLKEDQRRLSVDVDLLNTRGADEIMRIMKNINDKYKDLVSIKLYQPENPNPKLPLLTYDVTYDSSLGGKQKIKLEIMYDWNGKLKTTTIEPGFKILGIPIDFPINVTTDGSLLGDKITTLALGTIGLPERRRDEISKQVYDIAMLLKLARKETLTDSIEAYQNVADSECSYHGVNNDPIGIVRDIMISIDSLLETNPNFKLSDIYRERFLSFQGQLLGRNKLTVTEHLIDLLYTRLFATEILEVLMNKTRVQEIVNSVISKLQYAKELGGIEQSEPGVRNLLDSLRDYMPLQRAVKGLTPEAIYLVSEIQKSTAKFLI